MKMQRVLKRNERRIFYQLPKVIYRDNPYHRTTEESLTHLLVDGPTTFHSHATVEPYLLLENGNPVGRCAFIHDTNLPDYVQVSFFEALPGINNLYETLRAEARTFRPEVKKIVVGLNGHLNYGAGFLLNRFNLPPVFGLPYTHTYYADYFSSLIVRGMVSFRFSVQEFFAWGGQQPTDEIDGISVRSINMRQLAREIKQYTAMDNASFLQTPYWSARLPQENYELFHPFRHFMRGENLLFAERKGKPLGFLLWYPDFNELTGAGKALNALDVLRYRYANPIKTFRFTEIALLPHAQHSRTVYAMILKLMPMIRRQGYTHGEGGFIFENNTASLNMTRKFLQRAFGSALEPFRRYGVFEGEL